MSQIKYTDMENKIFTVGHSNHPVEHFFSLLRGNGITAVVDVRSQPYSRMNPQFNSQPLETRLYEQRIGYVFLGKELGARSEDPTCYVDNRVRYDLIARSDLFQEGIARLLEGMSKYRVTIMCAEKDPTQCHRMILISRHLASIGMHIEHVLSDGKLESHENAVRRLMETLKIQESDLFLSHDELVNKTYAMQEERIAYESRVAEQA